MILSLRDPSFGKKGEMTSEEIIKWVIISVFIAIVGAAILNVIFAAAG